MIRKATKNDLEVMLDLAAARREQYAFYHPLFHRPAPGAREVQGPFFLNLLTDEAFICLVSEAADRVDGFLIAHLIPAPPVYEPGGLTCVVDDFAVDGVGNWAAAGRALVDEIKALAVARGAVQIVVVTAPQDQPKRNMLVNADLSVASEWFVGETS